MNSPESPLPHSSPPMPARPHAVPRPYPLVLEPVLLEKVWGGRALERLGKGLPTGKLVGESWELADLGATSAGGAGGGAVRSRIAAGPLAGRTLHEAMALWGSELLAVRDRQAGEAASAGAGGDFPLLVKFLDARENLSVQVHPSPAYLAARRERLGQGAPVNAHLKTESWYIVHAEPGAKLYIGLREGVTRAAFERHIRDNTVINDLVAVEAIAGECHTLPSGTVHALGAGVVVAEVQTPSDTTFRVYDWGRTGRELHIDDSLACITFADTAEQNRTPPPARPSSLKTGQLCARLARTPYYTIDEVCPRAGDEVSVGYRCPGELSGAGTAPAGTQRLDTAGDCFALVVLAGGATLSSASHSFDDIGLKTGQTVLIPAAVARSAMLRAEPRGQLRVLRVGLG